MGKTDKTLADFIGSKRIGSNQLRAMGLPEWLPQSSVDPTAPVLPYGSSGEVQTVYFPIADMISGTIGAGVKEATGSDKLGFAAEMIAPSPTQIVKGLTKLGKPMMSEMTTWHGSPHKLDPEQLVRLPSGEKTYVGGKYNPLQEVPAGATVLQDFPAGRFREAAVGTGEGAQAYGHGVAYLAESKGVADEYAEKLSKPIVDFANKIPDDPFEIEIQKRLQSLAETTQSGYKEDAVTRAYNKYLNPDLVKSDPKSIPPGTIGGYARSIPLEGDELERVIAMRDAAKRLGGVDYGDSGYLYKTDIPDEAVARMLDWDKPLNEQKHIVDLLLKSSPDFAYSVRAGALDDPSNGGWRGRDLVGMLQDQANTGYARVEMSQYGGPAASKEMLSAGIPGIKYLDADSRSAGEGSRNFVPFDEDLIRILERNGIPTGAQPWKPGEWQGLGSRVEQTAAPYSLGDVTHGLPSNIPAAAPRVIDDNALRSLRSQATGLENASKGISLYITHDGKAIVSKPQGVKTPDRLKKFAAEHGLEYSEGTWRWPVSKSHPLYETAMPVEYRESGAKYHWE